MQMVVTLVPKLKDELVWQQGALRVEVLNQHSTIGVRLANNTAAIGH